MSYKDNRQLHTDYFLEELQSLNEAQLKAVTHIDGPMLVVAGPGTGKTHVLAARIGQILLETDALPENILCLTFTDAGAIAMRDRLIRFIGPTAHRVHIFTFHAFCNAIIQQNLAYFGKQDMEALSDLERIDLIRSLIDTLPPDHPLYRPGMSTYFYETHLSKLFQLMNKENWTSSFVIQRIDAWLAQLPSHPDFLYKINSKANRKGDIREGKLQQEQERMQKLRAAALLYPQYEQKKKRLARYDYEDMILWVWNAFNQHPYLLLNYQEKYQYILVDEYQDTNSAQNDILLQLLSYWSGNPNVFIVGDDDQSIYEFQGARLQNLTDFIKRFEDSIEVVVLNENYRSTQPILDAASALIQNNQLRLAKLTGLTSFEKVLRSAHPLLQNSTQFPVIAEYPSRQHENAHIVSQIQALLQENIPASEIAIIYAQHKQSRELLFLLQKKGIPYLTKRSINILETTLSQQLLEVLNYLNQELSNAHSTERLLFRILHFRFWGIPAQDLAALSLALTQENVPPDWSWRYILQHPFDAIPEMHPDTVQKLLNASQALEELISDTANLLLPALVERVINRSGLLHFVLEAPDKLESVQLLYGLLNFVQDTCERTPGMDLQGLLNILSRMQENRIPLPLNQIIGEQGGVQLMTAHSSKGLEFTYVFMLDAVKDYWEPTNRNGGNQFKLPETLSHAGEEDALEARRRLFYVAMTRARSFLHISYARTDAQQKNLNRTQFIDELKAGYSKCTVVEPSVSAEALLDAQATLLHLAKAPTLLSQEKTFVDDRLTQFTLSISALNTYLNCPLGFYYEHILKVPSLPSEAAVYGEAMHSALQKLFYRMTPGKAFPTETDFILFFEQAFQRKSGHFKTSLFDKYLTQGQHYLRQFYQTHIEHWHKDVNVEYTIRKVEIDGVPVTGVIDKIEHYPHLVTGIVDYKTGRMDEKDIARPSEKNPDGGIYWRQLTFYKLLFEYLDRSSRQVEFGEIQFLHPDQQGHFPVLRLDFEPEDSRHMRHLIASTYNSIQNKQFYTGCGKPTCKWCTFVQQTHVSFSLNNPDTANLDD